MTCTIDSKSKRRLPAKLAAGLAISAFLVLGTFVASAGAQSTGTITVEGPTTAVAMAVLIMLPHPWSMARHTTARPTTLPRRSFTALPSG